ncbi:transposon Tf2-9 polyprotein [Trichonephila clavipes]|nr:transposon Tf2-9 polyprotein [Trichonephila clavipes]
MLVCLLVDPLLSSNVCLRLKNPDSVATEVSSRPKLTGIVRGKAFLHVCADVRLVALTHANVPDNARCDGYDSEEHRLDYFCNVGRKRGFKTTFQKRITLDRNFSSEGTDQHSPFQHPVSNSPLPSVQGYSFMPAHQNVSSLCTQNTFPPYSNEASLTEMNTQFWTLLRDISATSRKFTGEDFYSVNSFFRDVKENFDLFQAISSSQKLIFAKRLVCGTAKSFLFSQRNLNTYESFKKALIEEFSDSVTSIEIHRELEKRKMYKTETLMQYFNSMRELANRCDSKIDEASIIQYVINGIDGPRSDKIILYGATSFSEFKQKLRTYETVIKNMGIHNSNSPNFRHSYESRGRDFKQQSFQRKPTKFNVSDAAKNPQRCFNCNDIGHLSKSCPNHSRGPR